MTKQEHEAIGKKFDSLKKLEERLEKLSILKREGIKNVYVYINEHNSPFVLDDMSHNVVLNMVEARYKRKIDKLKIELGAR